ncbi:MAG: GGDEF domain-containing protein [Gammaproteobacteria bacterium]|nr:GGDEF domain-containing protein [Gammaproteobacteria bacterium]
MSRRNEALTIIAHADLTNRARGGIVIYLLAWLTIMLSNQVHVSNPEYFYFNTAVIVLVMLSRLAHYYTFVRGFEIPLSLAYDWLIYSILLGALHWGLMSCWTLLNSDYAALDTYIIVSGAVLGIAGATALSISRRIRLWFPTLIMLPSITVLFTRGGTEDLIYASMAILALVYVHVTSKTASQDYWHAIKNHALAEQRATDMERLSVTDQLTQLKNRSYFDQRFGEEWKRGDRQNQSLSLLILDLDGFKRINDTHGHLFGDECLRQVARTLDSEIHRETDIVTRYGGEEFVLLMPDTEAQQAASVAEKLRRAIADIDIEHEGVPVRLTCSIGGATALPHHGSNRDNLFKRADHALYTAKANGRNRYHASVAGVHLVAG